MTKHTYGKELAFSTRAIHVGNDTDAETKAIKRPITMANSYELPYDPTEMNWSGATTGLYTRNGGSNQTYLEERLASLENGEDAIALASGVGALSGLFFTLLEKGDHVLFPKVSYIAVYRLFHELLNNKYGIETDIVDMEDLEAVEKAIKPNTKLIHIETPANPTISLVDVEKMADLAHKHNVLLSVDNTFASPYNQRPLEQGADFVIESLTKYINGHGDAMGGAIIGPKETLDTIRAQAQINLGATISPFNAWLIMRGMATLPLRMEKHNENALKIARWLEKQPGISFVSYPGLESHPQHALAQKQMAPGYGGVLSFGLNAPAEKLNEFVSKLNLITNAVSLGHDTSLIVVIGDDDERQYLYPDKFHNGFFRFSAGLEDADDLIADLQNALKETGLA